MSNETDDHGLALSATDAKPRLKWTRQLHQHFVEAVSELGGPERATPKSVMRIMRIPGITLYHLKSHLQKYRLAKSRESKAGSNTEGIMAADYRPREDVVRYVDESKTQPQFHNSTTMLNRQMEVQRRLLEQIEVQKHLQLRIEAQGKYLQSVLKKAQETLAAYTFSSSAQAEAADAGAECPSLLFSVPRQFLNAECSTESCLTCSEREEELKNDGKRSNAETSECSNSWSPDESNESNPCYGGGVSEGTVERRRRVHQMERATVFGPEGIDLNR
ncbi:uncharacterized protein A4U43_C03F70 [Asparagus officinalis]|uniref:Uncharacterized protein n=1 Tax=Asparagus officinalis TaxID=4686 RepID=A0A5P1F625_ASPOF|nr:myb-related protein 2-like [Asparagus officinalis]ONK73835.1 uncharacterized protein A4U43_C03F70 [Asparagus officinalis]